MKKTFCDKCAAELTDKNNLQKPLGINLTVGPGTAKIVVEVTHAGDHNGLMPDLCRYCVLDSLVKSLDDRPKVFTPAA